MSSSTYRSPAPLFILSFRGSRTGGEELTMRTYNIMFEPHRFLLLLATIFFLATPSLAEPKLPVHISGAYEVKTVVLHGPDARVSLEVYIVNGSGTDLSNATVSFSNVLLRVRPSVPPLVVRAHSNMVFDCAFTMPRQQYERWRRGARPTLSLQIPEPIGRKSTVLIRLANSRPGER